MMINAMDKRFALVALVVWSTVMVSMVGAQSVVGKGKSGPAPAPVNHDITGMFQAKFASVGDDLFIAGQPTEKALRDLKARGVTTVINLRMPEEMAQIGFDEAALIKELGMTYVHLPMRGSAENPYGPKQLDAFSSALASAPGKVLLHCTVAWRASHLWAAYLIRDRHVAVPEALAQARSISAATTSAISAKRHILRLSFKAGTRPATTCRRCLPCGNLGDSTDDPDRRGSGCEAHTVPPL